MPSMPGSGTGVPPEVEPPEVVVVEPPEVDPGGVWPPEVVVEPPEVLEHHLVHLQPHLPVAIAGEVVIIRAAAAEAAVSASLRVITNPPWLEWLTTKKAIAVPTKNFRGFAWLTQLRIIRRCNPCRRFNHI